MDLSIIIVNFNRKDFLDICLNSLFNSINSLPYSYEVIVVDNNSTDGSVELIENKYKKIVLIKNRDNLGFGKANNIGIKHSRGNFILFLNNDTYVYPGSIETLIKKMHEYKNVGAAGCLILNEDLSLQLSFGKMIDFSNEFFQKYLANYYYRLKWGRAPKKGINIYTDWISGACLITRADILEEIKYFDENFFMYTEEVDLCKRIKDKGWKILYTTDTQILHYRGKSTQLINKKTVLEYRKSQLYFYAKHYGEEKVKYLKMYLFFKFSFILVLINLINTFTKKDSSYYREKIDTYRRLLKFIKNFKYSDYHI
ncbi:MAG: glycosyltransferase family 2 protein [Acidobacteriota bacterium]